jgi:hypothetical protein
MKARRAPAAIVTAPIRVTSGPNSMPINDVDGAERTAAETPPAYTRAIAMAQPLSHFRGNHCRVTAETSRRGRIGHNRSPQPTRLDGENPRRSTNEKIS